MRFSLCVSLLAVANLGGCEKPSSQPVTGTEANLADDATPVRAVAEIASADEQRCQSVQGTNWDTEIAMMASFELGHSIPVSIASRLKRNGGLSGSTRYENGTCYIDYGLSGMIDGATYQASGICTVEEISTNREGVPFVSKVVWGSCKVR